MNRRSSFNLMINLEQTMAITYEIMQSGDSEEVAELIGDIFMKYEPMTICNKVDPKKMILLLKYLTAYSAEVGLIAIARDHETGKIVGAITNKDYQLAPTPNLPEKYHSYIEMFKADIAMCHELERVLDYREYKVGELFQPFHLCVLPDYTRQGIAKELVAQSLKIAKSKGYKSAMAECSVVPSRRAFESNGYQLINSINYEDFSYNNIKTYATIPGALVMVYKETI